MLRFDRGGYNFPSSVSTHVSNDFHFDLLSFLSMAVKLGVDLLMVASQPALGTLGGEQNSSVDQASVDRTISLAFKRVLTEPQYEEATDLRRNRFQALIFELLIVEFLRPHPNIINLIGVAWDVGPLAEDTLPVLVTEKSALGSLADYMKAETWKVTTFEEKRRICLDVARAIETMHRYGIIHGDIKCENVLLFPNDGILEAKVIDFGFSCFGSTDVDEVQLPSTVPWQAPEHGPQYFPLEAARRMDAYSFGMLLWMVMLAGDMPEPIRNIQHCRSGSEMAEIIDLLEDLKSKDRFIVEVQTSLEASVSFNAEDKTTLREVFDITLQCNPSRRTSNFAEIVGPLSGGDRSHETLPKTEEAFNPLSIAHEILDIGNILGDLDDMDYLVREALVRDLESRITGEHACTMCSNKATYGLGLCYALGFGVRRDEAKSMKMISAATSSDNSLPSLAATLSNLEERYESSDPKRLFEVLGYYTSLPFDPAEEYELQNRLAAAITTLRNEVYDREECLGKQSKSRISLIMLLAVLLLKSGQLLEAESICREASHTSAAALGDDDPITISCQNYLHAILWKRKNYAELEALTLASIEVKNRVLPKHDASLLNSRHRLGCIYFEQGRFQEALATLAELAQIRDELIGPDHPEALLTKSWVSRTLKEMGNLSEALELQRAVVEGSERVLGLEEEYTLERKEFLLNLLLDTNNFDESSQYCIELRRDCEDVLGPTHPVTISSLYDWARIQAETGKLAEAITTQEEVVDLSKTVLGEDDPDTLARTAYLETLHKKATS